MDLSFPIASKETTSLEIKRTSLKNMPDLKKYTNIKLNSDNQLASGRDKMMICTVRSQ
jgi:hypothetical protein